MFQRLLPIWHAYSAMHSTAQSLPCLYAAMKQHSTYIVVSEYCVRVDAHVTLTSCHHQIQLRATGAHCLHGTHVSGVQTILAFAAVQQWFPSEFRQRGTQSARECDRWSRIMYPERVSRVALNPCLQHLHTRQSGNATVILTAFATAFSSFSLFFSLSDPHSSLSFVSSCIMACRQC